MHLYSGMTTDFVADATNNRIASKLKESFFHYFRYEPPQSEVNSWQNSLRAMSQTIDLASLGQISSTALTREVAIDMGKNGLPNTFVPGRNLVFLTFTAALAYRRGLRHLVGGMCETDYSGYPDCRDDTIKAVQVALNLGMGRRFVLHTPLMWIDKAATWQLAHDLGGDRLVDIIITKTHTCYRGERGGLHDWGHGCGTCPACMLRAAGFDRFQAGRHEGQSSRLVDSSPEA